MVDMLETLAAFEAAKKDNKLMVIDFTATWCPPCQMIGPKFVEMAALPENASVKFYKLDVDANGEGSQAAGISCMPTFQFYKDGQKVDELQGANEAELKKKIAALMA